MWDLKKYVTFIRETYRISWREIYWKLWSQLYVLQCNKCQVWYHISELGNCACHLYDRKTRTSEKEPANWKYECCGMKYKVTDLINRNSFANGCQAVAHDATKGYNLTKEKAKKICDRIVAHQLIILENTKNRYIE